MLINKVLVVLYVLVAVRNDLCRVGIVLGNLRAGVYLAVWNLKCEMRVQVRM